MGTDGWYSLLFCAANKRSRAFSPNIPAGLKARVASLFDLGLLCSITVVRRGIIRLSSLSRPAKWRCICAFKAPAHVAFSLQGGFGARLLVGCCPFNQRAPFGAGLLRGAVLSLPPARRRAAAGVAAPTCWRRGFPGRTSPVKKKETT